MLPSETSNILSTENRILHKVSVNIVEYGYFNAVRGIMDSNFIHSVRFNVSVTHVSEVSFCASFEGLHAAVGLDRLVSVTSLESTGSVSG